MADNITLDSGDVVAADDVASVKYQIVKLAIGGDGQASLVSDTQGIPVKQSIVSGSGTITTQNSVPAGVATGGSAVEIDVAGGSLMSIQTVGTYTGALSVQVTLNGTRWVTLAGVPIINLNTGGYLAAITSALQSIFHVDVTGVLKARVTALAATTGSVAVNLNISNGTGLVALDNAIPAGANAIGSVTVASGAVTNTPVAPTTLFTNSAATVNNTLVRNAAATLWSVVATNVSASTRYLKFYNKVTAPAAGTDTPVFVMTLAAGATVALTGGATGIRFATGIGLAITGAAADSDTTVVAVGDVKVATSYT